MKRRRFSDEFKAKVALEAIKGQKTANAPEVHKLACPGIRYPCESN